MDVRKKGDWESWIKFFLKGVAEVADEATFSASAILKLKEEYTSQLYEKEGHPQECPSFFAPLRPGKALKF